MSFADHPIGFFALWLNKPSEYHAGPDEEQETQARIDAAFAYGKSQGIQMYGRFGSRWSTERQYFTFWRCPNLESLEETISRLEYAGDFKFADSEHIIGIQMGDADMTDESALAEPVQVRPEDPRPIGFFALWNLKESYYRDREEWDRSNVSVREVFHRARERGVKMYGLYNCRWSTRWEFFTFWIVPDLETLESVMAELEPVGDFKYADSRHIVGRAEPQFRFATHLHPPD
jgi:hypothetical protein